MSKRRISEEGVSDGISFVTVPTADTRSPKVFLLKENRLAVNLLCTAYKLGLWNVYGSCAASEVWLLIDLCSWKLSCVTSIKAVWWYKSSGRIGFFPFFSQYLSILGRIRAARSLIKNLLGAYISYTAPQRNEFVSGCLSCWDGVIFYGCAKRITYNSLSAMNSSVTYIFNNSSAFWE